MAYTVYYNTPGTILTYAQMQAELAALASANSWTYIDCGDSAQGNEIGGVVVNGGSHTKTVMIFGCIHGFEKLAARGVLDWLNYIAANPSVFSTTRFVVVPILNPDGYILNQRKNDNDVTDDDLTPWPRQVDLNRNFDRFWSLDHGSSTAGSENYHGPQADSEPETRVAQALFATYAPDIVFDIHTALNQIMAARPNYAPMKVAVDAAMTAEEFTPYPWVMNYTTGTLISGADVAGAAGYLLEFGGGAIHLEVNRCICALKTIIESQDSVTFESMNDFGDDPNCVAWMRHNSGYKYAISGTDWLEKNHFSCLSSTFSSTIKVEGDGAINAAAYPIKTDSTLSSDFPFKYGTENRILGFARWYRPAALPAASAWIYLAAKYDTSSKRSFGLVLYNNAGTYEIRAFIGHTGGTAYQPYTLCTFSSLSANTWFFVGLGYEGSDNSWHCEIWSESAQIDAQDGTFGYPIYLVDSPWCIGCFTAAGTRTGNSALTGYIDEGAFFKEKLSPTKIADIWAQEYTATASGITGTISATLANSTTSSAGAVAITGASAPTLASATLSSAGAVVSGITGSFAQTLADSTLSGTGTVAIAAALAQALADAAVSSSGSVLASGALGAILADSTVAATGTVAVSGSLASTLADATVSASSSASAIGALAATLSDASLGASGVVAVSGSASATLAESTASSAGRVAVSGAMSATLADAALSAYFGDSTPAQAAMTLASSTVTASGEVAIMGALSAALQDAFASGAGTVDIDAECAAILADCTGVIAGRVAIVGGGGATLAGATLSARAGANLVPDALPIRMIRVARENRIVRA